MKRVQHVREPRTRSVNTVDNTSTKPKSMSKMNKSELYELCKKQQEEIMTLQFHLKCLEMETEETFDSFVKKINLANEMARVKVNETK